MWSSGFNGASPVRARKAGTAGAGKTTAVKLQWGLTREGEEGMEE